MQSTDLNYLHNEQSNKPTESYYDSTDNIRSNKPYCRNSRTTLVLDFHRNCRNNHRFHIIRGRRIRMSNIPNWDYPASYDYEDEIEDNPYIEDEIKDRG